MFQIKGLTLTHLRDNRVLLDGFDFRLHTGDKVVCVGEEGNGKSTLLKWMYDPALIEHYAEAEGERILTGERLAYLPQELSAADASGAGAVGRAEGKAPVIEDERFRRECAAAG